MKCDELKSLLAEKDADVKAKKDKAVEYFNLCKDWFIGELIKKHINDGFSGRSYDVSVCDIVKFIAKEQNIDTDSQYFEKSNYCTSTMRIRRNYLFSSISHNCIRPVSDAELKFIQDRIENYNKIDALLDGFDTNHFIQLLTQYAKSKGFKQDVTTGRYSDKKTYWFDFKITRSKLENKCCSSQVNEDAPEYGAQYIALGIFIILAILGYMIC